VVCTDVVDLETEPLIEQHAFWLSIVAVVINKTPLGKQGVPAYWNRCDRQCK